MANGLAEARSSAADRWNSCAALCLKSLPDRLREAHAIETGLCPLPAGLSPRAAPAC